MLTKEWQKIGHDLANGACWYLAKIILLAGLMLYLYGGLIKGIDDSDISKWKRSGLKIHTDARTGVQYLSDGHGGLTPRLQKQYKVEDFLNNK